MQVVYRPTSHYAYHPTDQAVLSIHELQGRAYVKQEKEHILTENEIEDGSDCLGVLLYGHARNAYWYGSTLSIEETRRLAPNQNATALQVQSISSNIGWFVFAQFDNSDSASKTTR
jgi:homospermidine synthase